MLIGNIYLFVQVVVDVSYIYGMSEVDGNGNIAVPYDSESTAAIRLNNGMILYLREVSSYLALVCVMRDEFFMKRSLLDFNIDCFKSCLDKVFEGKK